MVDNKKHKPALMLRVMRFMFSSLGTVFPWLMGRWAYRLWFTASRFKAPAYETTIAERAKKSHINLNNKSITVWEWGEGPAVLFIHGWTGRGTQAAHFTEGLLAAGYRVIAFDAPAHGESEGKQTNILEFTDSVRLMEKEFGPFYAAITHSFGGMVLAYAMHLGVNVERVVCICPPATTDTLVKNFSHMLHIPVKSIDVMLKKLLDNFGADIFEILSTTNNVKNLTNSALIIHDKDDAELSWKDGESVAQHWPGAKLLLTETLGHRRILRDPETVKAAIHFITQD